MVEGHCALCGLLGLLRDSHILPRWVWRRIIQASRDEPTRQPIRIENNVAAYNPEQISEYMLCERCEGRFSTPEDYVARNAFQSDGKCPLKSACLIAAAHGHGLQRLHPINADWEALAFFGTSVIWRASVSKAITKARLGSYQTRLQPYLLGEEPFPHWARLELWVLPDPPERIGTWANATTPVTDRFQGYHRHHFMVFGLYFALFVGSRLDQRLDSTCIVHNDHHPIWVGDEQTIPLISSFRRMTKRAGAAGKLARDEERERSG